MAIEPGMAPTARGRDGSSENASFGYGLSANLTQAALAIVAIVLGQAFDKSLVGCFDKFGEFAWERYFVQFGGCWRCLSRAVNP